MRNEMMEINAAYYIMAYDLQRKHNKKSKNSKRTPILSQYVPRQASSSDKLHDWKWLQKNPTITDCHDTVYFLAVSWECIYIYTHVRQSQKKKSTRQLK